jgi:ABC-type dipeptide/oligopeptide/nickel transport system permease component
VRHRRSPLLPLHERLGCVLDPGDRRWHLFPPALVLSLSNTATLSRFARTQTLEMIGQDYIRTACAKGLADVAFTLISATVWCLVTLGDCMRDAFDPRDVR